ncbi:MAG: UDP-N-acetylmuramoyl-L-alanyl-D-glutamate--2,6-diaminopimelate ligase, partial [Steroidobacteraceae bacterium]
AAFLACKGATTHGLKFAQQAVTQGARAVLWEPAPDIQPPQFNSQIFVAAVPDLGARAGELANRFFGEPSRQLQIAGITGTNGKTTTAVLLAQALQHCGRKTFYIGTLGSGFPGEIAAGTHTTPDAVSIQRELAQARAQKARCVSMEVSSHALDQERIAAVQMNTAVFTNLTRDHLDYHGDMQRYGAAKEKLFERPDIAICVVNVDDEFGAELAQRCSTAGSRLIVVSRRTGVSIQGAEFLRAEDLRLHGDGVRFRLRSSWGEAEVSAPLLGEFNIENLCLVLAVLLGWNVPLQKAVDALRHCVAPPGRMEVFGGNGEPLAVVDYAHTPDALLKALSVLRAHCTGRLWCVFGCGGDRDRGKRSTMGRIADELSDFIVLTDDNPRGESPAAILNEISGGISVHRPVMIHDRAHAIAYALGNARADDAVLIAGKGHENYQMSGVTRRSFSDQREVRSALAARSAR